MSIKMGHKDVYYSFTNDKKNWRQSKGIVKYIPLK